MMDIKGKLVKKLPLQTGQGRNGEWKKQDIILETEGTYPKKVCISVWGDKLNVPSLQEGSLLNVSVDVESREFNEKWYTDVRAWKIDVVAGTPQETLQHLPPPDVYQNDSSDSEGASDLPF
jgi:hypothetical protein